MSVTDEIDRLTALAAAYRKADGRTVPSETAPDRNGNPRFSDQQQIAFFDFYLDHFVGFQGTIYERGVIAEAWWMGDWSPEGRCPSLDEAKAFLSERR